MLILIVLLPLLGFFSGSVFGRVLGWGSCYITTLSVFSSLSLSLVLLYDVVSNGVVYKVTLGSWIISDNLQIDWSFCFDSLTSIMLIVVTFISTLVHLYSTEYMGEDPHLPRFMSYLSFFTFFMLILVTADNYIQMFVG
jgi:NADH:ubiquinone oxidoreductase subunit 5 (subunit L)/multisubunit Na+/H+ antiporter MnhA subunit